MNEFVTTTATVLGNEHRLCQRNSQDALAYKEVQIDENEKYLIGLVCDGCGEGQHSEVGAKLLAEFLATEACRQLVVTKDLELISTQLHSRALAFLDSLCQQIPGLTTTEIASSSPKQYQAFVRDYLLATILGFVVGSKKTIVFAAGDGLIVINDQILVRDENNQPHYLAYNLLQSEVSGFEVYLLETAAIERLAIWTDGFAPQLAEQSWNLSGGVRRLQRKLNLWAKQQLFADDTTGIMLERVARGDQSDECNN